MTFPQALFSGARQAVALARACEQSADEFDDEWRGLMAVRAAAHRERARKYLLTRKQILTNRAVLEP